MKRALLPLAFFLTASALAGVTTNNDDSCDIAWQPAATLLLPYFEVDFQSPQTAATQTLFTIQNTSAIPQIARATLWTDWGFPAYSFPVFLGGYDVQGFNLYDLFAGGTVVKTSIDGPVPLNPSFGSQPAPNNANPNFLADVANSCHDIPAPLTQSLLDELRRMFTTGKTTTGCTIGGAHANAIGYATVDVVATCAARNPTSSGYFSILLYDNVLTGDYQQLVPRGDHSYAQGSALVHIRAIPEGGPAGAVTATNLPYTFYDHLTTREATRKVDRRQPLPSAFAPRWIAGGPGGLNTTLKIWREVMTPPDAACTEYVRNFNIPVRDRARFDEQENATLMSFCPFECPLPPGPSATSAIPLNSYLLPPPSTSGDSGGWLYLNLDGLDGNRPLQAWVITSMFAEPTYAIETMAIALGNGCSPRSTSFLAPIGPAPNPTP
jgi:hypothetical protein